MNKLHKIYIMPHPPIVIPEIGKADVNKISNTFSSMNKVAKEINEANPDTIIIITPHGPMFSDAIALAFGGYISGSFHKFGAPQVKMELKIDKELTQSIWKKADELNITTTLVDKAILEKFGADFTLDHGAMVPLYFVNKELKDYKLVHITYSPFSSLQLYSFGIALQKAVEETDKKVVLIASGDLSHKLKDEGPYGFSPSGPIFDDKITTLLQKGDVMGIFDLDKELVSEAGECGLRSIYIMLGAMDGYEVEGNLLSYEGPFGVGYGVMSLNNTKTHKDIYKDLLLKRQEDNKNKLTNQEPYVALARESLTYYLKTGEVLAIPANLPLEMVNLQRGVFVSLKKHGALRGCIGTIFPMTNCIASEIIRNAIAAGTDDPRFNEVEEEELYDIDFSVDVLTNPENALIEELDTKKYGVIVTSGYKKGLLLPDLEGVDTVEKQISIALNKAGIKENEKYTIQKFEVIRYK